MLLLVLYNPAGALPSKLEDAFIYLLNCETLSHLSNVLV